jgi:hypothetical protein
MENSDDHHQGSGVLQMRKKAGSGFGRFIEGEFILADLRVLPPVRTLSNRQAKSDLGFGLADDSLSIHGSYLLRKLPFAEKGKISPFPTSC